MFRFLEKPAADKSEALGTSTSTPQKSHSDEISLAQRVTFSHCQGQYQVWRRPSPFPRVLPNGLNIQTMLCPLSRTICSAFQSRGGALQSDTDLQPRFSSLPPWCRQLRSNLCLTQNTTDSSWVNLCRRTMWNHQMAQTNKMAPLFIISPLRSVLGA